MKLEFKSWLHWLKQRPVAIINLAGLIFAFSIFGYLMLRPVDVLSNWHVAISDAKEYRVVNGERMAVYHPGDSLVFTSESTKLEDAKGTTSRMIVCEATEKQAEREIQLDSLPATRPVGQNPTRQNAIVVPDVAQFNELPRTCRLVFDIVYDVMPLRTWQEHAETDKFLVEEEQLTSANIRRMINELNERIKTLESQLDSIPESTSATSATTQSVTKPTQTSQKTPSISASQGTSTQSAAQNPMSQNNSPTSVIDILKLPLLPLFNQ